MVQSRLAANNGKSRRNGIRKLSPELPESPPKYLCNYPARSLPMVWVYFSGNADTVVLLIRVRTVIATEYYRCGEEMHRLLIYSNVSTHADMMKIGRLVTSGAKRRNDHSTIPG